MKLYDKPLSLDDLFEGLANMANEKNIGLDYFPYGFYKPFRNMVDLDLLHVCEEALEFDSLGDIMNMKNIKFITKSLS